MTLPLTSSAQLERDALLLATTIARMDAGQADPSLPEVFSETLERVLSYDDPLEEVRALGHARDLLVDGGAISAAQLLFEEAEMASECVDLETPAGEPRIGVLFAIPVVLSAKDIRLAGKRLTKVDQLHEAMELAEVVSCSAEYGLLSHLVPADSLQTLTYGQLRAMTLDLATQVVEGEGPALKSHHAIPPLATLPQGEPLLYFLVGVAVIPEEDSGALFWARPEDQADSFVEWAISTQQGIHARGSLPNHKPWGDEFSTMLEHHLSGATVLAVGEPAGIHDDMRQGWHLWREQTLLETFNAWVATGISLEGVTAGFRPLPGGAGTELGWAFVMIAGNGSACTVPWPILKGESTVEAFNQMVDTVAQTGLDAPGLRAKIAASVGCVQLH